MAELVYILTGLASLSCAALLTRAYRRSRSHLLLWSAVCFAALAANSVLVVLDLIVLPNYDLRILRIAVALVGVSALLWALINEQNGGAKR